MISSDISGDNHPIPAAVTQGPSPSARAGVKPFQDSGCVNCYAIQGVGGQRGPDLTDVGARLTPDQLTRRILNGWINLPEFGANLTPDDTAKLVEFLGTLKGAKSRVPPS